MPRRSRQILLVGSVLWVAWLGMMLVHECGHVLEALVTGGQVQRVVWHPAAISRTEVRPNPHPLVEVGADPVFGSAVPLLVAGAASLARLRAAYLLWAIAGFCLIANGAYVGIGVVRPDGDAAELVAHGMPRWALAAFGVPAVSIGFWIWHRISPRLDFGVATAEICAGHAYLTFAAAVTMTAAGIAFGDRGI